MTPAERSKAILDHLEAAALQPPCAWFALCDRQADGVVPHPVLGPVPTCGRCRGIAARHAL